MAYSEIRCKLCGVSFNINRIRRPDEPYYTAWKAYESFLGDEHRDENFVSRDLIEAPCSGSTGCRNRQRQFVSSDDGIDDSFDSDYSDIDEVEDEALEYVSDEDSLSKDAELPTEDESQIANVSRDHSTSALAYCKESGESTREDYLAEDETDSGEDYGPSGCLEHERWTRYRKLEHLAGPGCFHHSGYSGYKISADQVRGCTTSQCLVRKDANWKPEKGDQDFELTSDYFLSGLSNYMPPRNDCLPNYVPSRHGTEELHPDTTFWAGSDDLEQPMPFHPTCFEIFAHASRKRTGHVDVNGLMGWRKLESDYRSNLEFPYHFAVRNGVEDWEHTPGNEWLATNPIIVPGLRPLLWSAVQDLHPASCPLETLPSVLTTKNCSLEATRRPIAFSKDPFTSLPRELSDDILGYLDPVDVASLRLASCIEFLPILHWRRLLEKEMPWLWEIWDPAEPSFWVTVSHHGLKDALKRCEQAHLDSSEQQTLYRNVIQEEMPDLWEAWISDNPWLDEIPSFDIKTYLAPKTGASKTPHMLPQTGTNWCQVYYEVKKNLEDLKGLQNRERIWADVEEILRRISEHRREGRIV